MPRDWNSFRGNSEEKKAGKRSVRVGPEIYVSPTEGNHAASNNGFSPLGHFLGIKCYNYGGSIFGGGNAKIRSRDEGA